MKQLVLAILAFLYLGTSTGATVHMHYCMGKPAGWSLTQEEKKKCGKCAMEKTGDEDNACCNDEQHFIKNESDQKSSVAFQLFIANQVAVPVPFILFLAADPSALVLQHYCNYSPPNYRTIGIYKRNCVFLI